MENTNNALFALLLARLRAMELALACVITADPHRDAAGEIWNAASLDFADEAFDAVDSPDYREQMPVALERWSRAFLGPTS